MERLQNLLSESQRLDIHLLAEYIIQHIQQDWDKALHETEAKMVKLFAEIGDSAYATYNKRLFDPIHEQFKQCGLRASPALPGDLMTSREWGRDEQNRQRWMWSEISTDKGAILGTIVIVVFHDHEQIRIPRPFQVLALEEIGLDAVTGRLAMLSSDFKNAPDMKTEVAQYLAQNPDTD